MPTKKRANPNAEIESYLGSRGWRHEGADWFDPLGNIDYGLAGAFRQQFGRDALRWLKLTGWGLACGTLTASGVVSGVVAVRDPVTGADCSVNEAMKRECARQGITIDDVFRGFMLPSLVERSAGPRSSPKAGHRRASSVPP